jgi:RHS repeat-associated protein
MRLTPTAIHEMRYPMTKFMMRRATLSFVVMGLTVLAGWGPVTLVSPAYAATKPMPPVAYAVSSNPIVSGTGDLGYLPGAGEVSTQGQYTYTIPLEVPPGRAGMQPALALSYSSGAGNGILGMGWSLSGLSTISRCGQTLSTDGQVKGIHLTDSTGDAVASDRFCLGGKELVAINGIYGQLGTEYRTEEDSYAKIVATAAPSGVAKAANEPQFVVQTKAGKTLTYTALYGTPMETVLLGPDTTTGTYNVGGNLQAIVGWVLSTEVDQAGNGVSYTYCAVTATGSSCPVTPATPLLSIANAPAWIKQYAPAMQWELQRITYTTAATGSAGATGYRSVQFTYENLPAGIQPDYQFQAGVATGVFQRLSKITMWAPNPGATVPVWQYDISYLPSSFSGHELLSAVKRCALDSNKDPSGGTEGGCTWKKEFAWTTDALTGPAPKWGLTWQTVYSGTVGGLNAANSSSPTNAVQDPLCDWAATPYVSCLDGMSPGLGLWLDNPPVAMVLDADGDGRDDVLFQPGGPGSPRNYLFTAAATGAVTTPLAVMHDAQAAGLLQSSADSAAQGNRQALQSVYPLDIDGDGSSEIYVTQSTITGQPAPPDSTQGSAVTCQSKVLHWGGDSVGFVDAGLNFAPFECRDIANARQWDLFLDIDGDGRLDHLQAQTIRWMGNPYPQPGDPAGQLDPNGTEPTPLPSFWQTTQWNTSIGGQQQLQVLADLQGTFTFTDYPDQTGIGDEALANGAFAGCPSYVVDFAGEGKAQLFGQPGTAFAGFAGTDNQVTGQAFGFELCGIPSSPPLWDSGFTSEWVANYFASLPSLTTTLQSFDWATGAWRSETDATPMHDVAQIGRAKWPIMLPIIGGSNTALPNVSPSIRHTAPGLIFGDFNGDGLEDVIEPDQDPVNTGKGIMWLRWNTGNGFGPRIALPNTGWAMGEPNTALPAASSYQVYVTDLNHDGRADLVVYHKFPLPAITLMLSNGDGTFLSMDVPTSDTDPGIQTWDGQWTGAVGDFNGDGYTDLLRLEGAETVQLGASAQGASHPGAVPIASTSANLQVLSQVPVIADRVQAVFDEPTAWPREAVTYSLQWSDKPEPITGTCAYPIRCEKHGSVVVREVDYRDTLADVPAATASVPAHAIYYSYEDPVADMRGRGSLGFRKVRQWDPTRLSQTVTEYDNRTQAQVAPLYAHTGQNYYPNAMRPQQVTQVTLLPSPNTPQTVPLLPRESAAAPANARVVQTRYAYQTSPSNGGLTYVVQPLQQITSEWEQTVEMTADVRSAADPTSDYLWNPTTPYTFAPPTAASVPLRVSTTQIGGAASCNNGAPASGIDAYGNVMQTVTHTSGHVNGASVKGVSSLSCSSFVTPNTATWQVGLLQSSSVTMTESGGASVKRGSRYDYDPTTHLLAHDYQLQFASASDTNPTTLSTTTLSRDGFGNVITMAIQAIGSDGTLATRQVNIEYDALWPNQPDERIFPSQQWVPAPYPGGSVATVPSSWSLIQPAYGVPVQTIDANGVQATNTYDDQGRLIRSMADGQAPMTVSYAGRPDVYGGQNGLITKTEMAGQVSTVSTDADGRTLGATHLGFDGTSNNNNIPQINATYVTYDLLGRAVAASRPYPSGVPTQWPPTTWPILPPSAPSVWPQRTTTYDGLNRALVATAPDSTTQAPVQTLFAPGFFTSATQDPNAYQHQVTIDINGRVVTSADLLAGTWVATHYAYAPFNQLAQVTDPQGNVESTSYDTLGRPSGSISPDAGTTNPITYDGFGELVSSTHQPSGAVTTQHYDTLGRPTTWQTIDGAVTTGATFTYDTQLHGLGKLATATSSDGVLADNVVTSLHYDTQGRTTGTDETVGGHTYSISANYNSLGQLSQLNLPSIGSSMAPGLTLPYTYTATGQVSEIDYIQNGVSLSPLPPIWRTMTSNLDGALVEGEFGNNVTAFAGKGAPAKFAQAGVIVQNSYLSATGRLQQILATSTIATAPLLNLNYTYYPNGLVQTRTDQSTAGAAREETYTYDGLKRLTGWDLQVCAAAPCTSAWSSTQLPFYTYTYDTTGNLKGSSTLVNQAGWKYAALQTNTYGVSAGPHALTTQNASGSNMSYGYDLHGRQTNGGNRTLVYNAYNLPKTVTTGSGTWTMLYDAFGHRAQKSGTDGTTVYVGAQYEKRTSSAGVVDVFHVPGGELQYNESNQTTALYGEFTDALGSVGTVFNSSTGNYTGAPGSPGTTVSTFFYDPFGTRITATGSALTSISGLVTDGFTGQEHDDDWGLINFRGRLYNPTLKRFMSTDPHVTTPGFSQSWNPYSYVLNSPTNLTDPTGFDPDDGGAAVDQPPDPGQPIDTGGDHTVIMPTDLVQVPQSQIALLGVQGTPPPPTSPATTPAQSGDGGATPVQPTDPPIGPQQEAAAEIRDRQDFCVANFGNTACTGTPYWQAHQNRETANAVSTFLLWFLPVPKYIPKAGENVVFSGEKATKTALLAKRATERATTAQLAAKEANVMAEAQHAGKVPSPSLEIDELRRVARREGGVGVGNYLGVTTDLSRHGFLREGMIEKEIEGVPIWYERWTHPNEPAVDIELGRINPND